MKKTMVFIGAFCCSLSLYGADAEGKASHGQTPILTPEIMAGFVDLRDRLLTALQTSLMELDAEARAQQKVVILAEVSKWLDDAGAAAVEASAAAMPRAIGLTRSAKGCFAHLAPQAGVVSHEQYGQIKARIEESLRSASALAPIFAAAKNVIKSARIKLVREVGAQIDRLFTEYPLPGQEVAGGGGEGGAAPKDEDVD